MNGTYPFAIISWNPSFLSFFLSTLPSLSIFFSLLLFRFIALISSLFYSLISPLSLNMASDFSAPNALLSSYIYDALDMLESEHILNYFQHKDLDQSFRNKLRSSLLSINLVMDDAENKHLRNQHKQVSRWLHEVRDVVHDVDDILDEIQTEASQSRLPLVAEFQTITSSSSSSSSFDDEVQSRLKEVLANLELLASEKDSLGLEKINSSSAKSVSQRLETTSLEDEAAIYGRDDDKKAIIDLLLSDNHNGTSGNNLTVISIVGMGGMGKTTLAELVFNDTSMDDEFQLKAWVRVSQDFDVTKVTRTILQAFNVTASGEDDLNTLQNELKEKLEAKKYLIVLDDVWEEKNKKLETLQAPLLYGSRGSKILVTTRSEKVASTMRCAHVYPLKKLSEEQSWLLFAKHALSPANSTSDFEEIGKNIIRKCDGLPLALKAIGSLMHNNSCVKEWNRILTSHMWDISDTGYDIIPALILSYQFLPFSLKRCFAYCSLIPKDFEFDKDWVVELWMAENFLQVHPINKGMKELGDQFFNDLFSRSFFQRSTRKEELFVMHDLVIDLATYVSRVFCLRFEEEEQATNISKMTRHISHFEWVEAPCTGNKLRTFLSFSNYHWSNIVDDMLCKCKCLRALSLHFVMSEVLPDSIGYLQHLRYLDLSNCSLLRKLPDSICLLYNLQTLKLIGCSNLKELPSNMHRLVNLCHLDFEGTEFRKLPDMENFKKLKVFRSTYVGKCFELLRFRGELYIKKSMKLKKYILTWIRWECPMNDLAIEEDELEKVQPPANLKKLYIGGYDGTKFSDWLGDTCINNNNIMSLELNGCKYCVSLPPLGMLPSLKELRISGLGGIKSISAEFYGNNKNNKEMDSHPHNSSSSSSTVASPAPFRSLQHLTFYRMKRWEEWDCESATSSSPAFACLKKLSLYNCPKLKSKLPQHLPSLLDLQIIACPQVVGAYNKKKELLPGSSYTCLQKMDIRCWEIQILQEGHPFFNSLQTLYLVDTNHTDEAFPLYLFPKLHRLKLSNCRNLERLDVGTATGGDLTSHHHHHLTELYLINCPEFVSFPQTLFFPSLTLLWLQKCPKLASIPPFTLFPSLVEFTLYNCPQVQWPEPEEEGPQLMDVATRGVTSHHHHLTQLNIRHCPELVSIPQILFFPSLTHLMIWECPKLASIPTPLFTHFPSLTELRLEDCPQVEWPEPEEEGGGGGGFPSTLEKLIISNCPKLLASHNKWDLHTLTSLIDLVIKDEHRNDVDCKGWLSLPPNLRLLNWKFVRHEDEYEDEYGDDS